MRPILFTLLLIATSLASVPPASAAECVAWADAECIQPSLKSPTLEYPTLITGPDLEALNKALEKLDLGSLDLPGEVISPGVDCNVGKRDVCALVEETLAGLITCEGECVDIPPVEEPDVIGTVMGIVDNLCRRQNCDVNDLIPQDVIDTLVECVSDDDCIPLDDYVTLVQVLIAAVTLLVGNYIDTVCETANDCDTNALIAKAVTAVTNAIATVCGTNQVANCDPSHLIPEVCLNRPVDVPLILPGGTQDADGDGVPGIRYTQSTASTNVCNTQTTPGSPGTLPAPDPDDGDPNVPIPDPSSICRDIDQPIQSTYAQATLVSDADGDGVPSIVVPIYSAGVDGDCQPVITQTGEYRLGPDPDDNDPSNPINPAYCDMREGFGVNLPGTASQADADGDGFPVLTIQYTHYELQSDCSIQTSPGTTGTVAIDPDDGDDQNPIASDEPVCGEYARAMWIPTGAAQTDNDGDGIPVVGLAEREYVLDSDCNLQATGNQRVNEAFMAGDPDDADPDVPVPRQIEPCNNIDATQLWIPYVPTSQDQDGDGVPVVTMRERLVSLDPDCTVTPTTQYRSGGQYGDPDDADPDNPGVTLSLIHI